jgi:protein-S-isoprenylcysteine O-methyltransferase Ste14
VLATLWVFSATLLAGVIARGAGAYAFTDERAELLGTPLDVLAAWSLLLGTIPSLVFPRSLLAAPLALALVPVALAAAAVDRAAVAVAVLGLAVVPGQLLASWTARGVRPAGRAALQFLAFPAIPAAAIVAWAPPDAPAWVVALLGAPLVWVLAASLELARRGGGTQCPFDPTERLVTTGLYAYVRNPMQISVCMSLVALGAIGSDPRAFFAAVAGAVLGIGFAGWDEEEALERRFGPRFRAWRSQVRRWWPRWRPFHPSASSAPAFAGARRARLLVPGERLRTWLERRRPVGLELAGGESLAYVRGDGTSERGAAALACALEHVHLGFALAAAPIRLALAPFARDHERVPAPVDDVPAM